MIINPNDPAMPMMPYGKSYGGETTTIPATNGLTIRAEIAARAMQGIYASLKERAITKSMAKQVAMESVQASDALIAELNKTV